MERKSGLRPFGPDRAHCKIVILNFEKLHYAENDSSIDVVSRVKYDDTSI